MPDHRPIRACAIQEDAFEEPHLITLWETDPHMQTELAQAVAESNAIDQELATDPLYQTEWAQYGNDAPGLLHALVWQDFPTMAAVAAANSEIRPHLRDAVGTIGAIINGSKSPTYTLVRRIADAFGVSMETVLGPPDPPRD